MKNRVTTAYKSLFYDSDRPFILIKKTKVYLYFFGRTSSFNIVFDILLRIVDAENIFSDAVLLYDQVCMIRIL